MITKSCCICDKECKKANFNRCLKSNTYELKSGTETKCKKGKHFYNTEQESQ